LESHVAAIGMRCEMPWDKLEGLASQWLRFGRAINLSGAKDLSALAEHVAEGLEVVALAERLGCGGGRWIDVGSGAGFPGLIVAACLPVEAVLVEPRERRAAFLELMMAELRVGGRVVRGRLERYGVEGLAERFDWASARAVFPPAEWLERSRALLVDGGITVVHLHSGDPDPAGYRAVGSVDGGRWSVRGYRCST